MGSICRDHRSVRSWRPSLVLVIFGTDPLIGGRPRAPPVDIAPSPYGPRASIEIRAEVAAPRRPTNGSDKAMPRRNYLKRILLLGRGWDEWDRRSEQAQKLARVQVKSTQGLSVRPSATPSAQRTVQPTSAHLFGTKPAATRHARPVKAARTPAHHGTKAHSPAKKQPLDGEADLPGATVWLYRAAPDPTPPAARLRIAFARELVADSR